TALRPGRGESRRGGRRRAGRRSRRGRAGGQRVAAPRAHARRTRRRACRRARCGALALRRLPADVAQGGRGAPARRDRRRLGPGRAQRACAGARARAAAWQAGPA
ncbi:hypothetical protein T492DRAFT_611369, partial [Pavlovales sp. CCMP2436]